MARDRRTLLLAAGTLLALTLLAGVAWSVLDVRASTADRQERVEVATDFALALLAYDHADLDASVAAVAAVATPGFTDDYRDRFVTALGDEAGARQAVATAEVTEVFLAVDPPDVDARDVDRTRALVGAEVEVRTADAAPVTSSPTLELVLVRTDDGWRVDDAGGAGRAGLDASG